jgi:hypothetical protein
MAIPSKDLKHRIDTLDDSDKLLVANYILEGLDLPDPLIDKVWVKESRSRLRAMRSGEMKVLSYRAAIAAHLKK